jgi:NAD(P)H-nitrite reductase large subunit
VVDGTVSALESENGRLAGARLERGTLVPVQALVVAPRFTARAGFLGSLGLEASEQEMNGMVIGTRIPAGPTGQTAVPGVWAAGNVTELTEQVIGSAAAGLRAAAAINADLMAEETRAAVEARRADFSDVSDVSGISDISDVSGSSDVSDASGSSDVTGFSPEAERRVSERVLGSRRHGL